MTADLLLALRRYPLLDDARAALVRHPDCPKAQKRFHAELQRCPDVLELWREHYETETA